MSTEQQVVDNMKSAARQTPLHEWAKRLIEERIESGVYKTDQLLPSATALAQEFSVSLITVRRALRELQFAGAIRSTTGVGSFVNERARFVHHLTRVKDPLYSITDDAKRLGKKATTDILSVELKEPLESEFRLFDVSSRPHYCIKKLILVDGRPITLDYTYITMPLSKELLDEFSRDFVYEVLKRRNFVVPRSSTYIDANPAPDEAARLLGIAPGFPMLRRFYAPEIKGSNMSIYGMALSPFDRMGIMIER
jgi:DNA-binding GntR family transcriptional regulator